MGDPWKIPSRVFSVWDKILRVYYHHKHSFKRRCLSQPWANQMSMCVYAKRRAVRSNQTKTVYRGKKKTPFQINTDFNIVKPEMPIQSPDLNPPPLTSEEPTHSNVPDDSDAAATSKDTASTARDGPRNTQQQLRGIVDQSETRTRFGRTVRKPRRYFE